MPNPLILTTAAPQAEAKPEKQPRHAQDPEGGATFEDILKGAIPEKTEEPAAVDATVALDVKTDSVEPESEVAQPTLPTIENTPPKDREPSVELIATNPETPRQVSQPDRVTLGEKALAQPMVGDKTTPSLPDAKPLLRMDIQAQPETARDQPARTPQHAPASQIAEQAIIMRASVAAPEKTVEQTVKPSQTHAEPTTVSAVVEKAPITVPKTEVKRAPLVVNQPQPAGPVEVNPADLAPESLEEGEGITVTKTDSTFGTVREGAAPQTTGPARADIARAVAGQMAAVIAAKPGSGGVEIALSPEELGRVSITLNGREDGLHLTIAAERPETLDLMRRHIAVLTEEFQKLGYGDLSFDLGTSADTPQDRENDNPQTAYDVDDPQPEPAAHPIPTGLVQGLDMRL
ncbi:flagellar hook-length control protein FliK [Ruegeria sp.]|uniref:flagellar hook-length control protein FliK n=1 Tax=Ruegeria sp. TaxID=1879320 RepID=UPI00230F39D5|nr:flagellar hook-length control protein FliK [Ruegeria sp.]MDA7964565.1 flagellar hook-length control protein FliK [Ruegeria sp.]